jgi:hypothetical protein
LFCPKKKENGRISFFFFRFLEKIKNPKRTKNKKDLPGEKEKKKFEKQKEIRSNNWRKHQVKCWLN